MTKSTRFLINVLAAALILGACAPNIPAATAQIDTPSALVTEPASVPAAVTESPAGATETPTVVTLTEPPLIVTPRGDALEATDPTTVKLGAGQPVLVEFFRFT